MAGVPGEAQGTAPIWYRGQSKSEHELIPSLLRHRSGVVKERALFEDYERSASHLLGAGKTDWEMLNDMQHYGLPTRLLDWTTVLGIAIAFALYDANDDSIDSAIFVLNPLALNALSGLREIKRVPGDSKFDYKKVYWDGDPFSPAYPIAIDGKLHSERLRAQNGAFTVAGLDKNSLDEQAPQVVRKVLLPSSAKSEARDFLEYANLNAFSVYPDIVGMARHIARRHFG